MSINCMSGFWGVAGNGYRSIKWIRIKEVKNAVNVLKNRKATWINKMTKIIIKNGGQYVIEWVCKICFMAFEGERVSERITL